MLCLLLCSGSCLIVTLLLVALGGTLATRGFAWQRRADLAKLLEPLGFRPSGAPSIWVLNTPRRVAAAFMRVPGLQPGVGATTVLRLGVELATESEDGACYTPKGASATDFDGRFTVSRAWSDRLDDVQRDALLGLSRNVASVSLEAGGQALLGEVGLSLVVHLSWRPEPAAVERVLDALLAAAAVLEG